MADSKALTGTPGALRLKAYRQRLREGELARVEILLPKPVRTAAQAIAEREGAKYLETVSALTQLGLETYETQRAHEEAASLAAETALRGFTAPAVASFASNALSLTAAAGASPGLLRTASLHQATTSSVASPLARFLKARKEGSHGE